MTIRSSEVSPEVPALAVPEEPGSFTRLTVTVETLPGVSVTLLTFPV